MPEASADILQNVRQEGDAIVASVHGEIDLHNSPDFRGRLMRSLEGQSPKRLVLDLGDVPYMDSSAIAVLVETLGLLRRSGGKLYLANVQQRVRDILQIARLETIFEIVPDVATGLK